MTVTLNNRFLRTAHPKDIALHLRELALANTHSLNAISDQLLAAIASESVPPMIFALWTSACPDDSATVAGMQCSHSIIVRSSAIRNFRRRLRSAKCEELWRALGGNEGIVTLLSSFSVIHVKEFCKAVARCSTSKQATAKRQSLVTDLLKALTSSSGEPASGTRNLLDQYTKLVHTCAPAFKAQWISEKGYTDLDMVKIFELDVAHYQQQCLRAVSESNGTLGADFEVYLPLFRSVPQLPHADDPSISASMAFAVKTLETAQQAGVSLNGATWLEETMYSLLDRILRRKSFSGSAGKILTSIACCVQQQSDDVPLRQYASTLEDQYLGKIMQLWQRDPDMYEPILTPLLRAHNVRLELLRPPYNKHKPSIQASLSTTKRQLRYRFLRWVFSNHPGYRVDIEDGLQLEENLKVSFPPELLFLLPSAEALKLLERYNAHSTTPLKLNIGALNELEDEPRIELLRLYLMDDPDAVYKTARERASHSKQMAQDSGSQPIRSAWIRASICFAVASQSLDLLQEIVLWARRFSRDPKTVIELYGSYPDGGYALSNERTLALLSGMPGRFRKATTILQVTQNVRKGNEVMLDLLHSATQTQSDPSFKPRQWETVKLLFKQAVLVRLERVNSLQTQLKLSDDETFTAVWKDTIDTLIKAETLGLASDNSSLELNDMRGPMGLTSYGRGTRSPKVVYELSSASSRFINELAVLRESLWTRHRITEHPAVTTLPPPWPRGLPMQAHWFLGKDPSGWRTSVRTDGQEKSCDMPPFLEKRVHEVVFMQPEQALSTVPSDDEIQSAIGGFIDDYRLTLSLYLSFGAPDLKDERLQAAWSHAIENLSGDRMFPIERRSYWREHFLAAGALESSSTFTSAAYPDLKLPTSDDDTTDPIEWHPGPEMNVAASKTRKLDPLTIDCLVEPFPSHWRRGPHLLQREFDLKPLPSTEFWNLQRYNKKGMQISQETREAFIAAALLLVDGRSRAGSKIFSSSFPSAKETRFPAIFLDAELLDSKEPTDEDVAAILKRFLHVIPPTLLKNLAKRLVEKAFQGATPSNVLRRWTTLVLGLLVMSDRPDLATDMIVQVILGNPGETHWHRVLLHPGVLKRLSPDHARDLMQRLAEGILERLPRDANSSVVVEAGEQAFVTPGPFTPSTSTVKVTTAKMLAQVLKDAAFLGDDFVVNTLVSLFLKATHVHVRAAVVSGLANALYTSRVDSTRNAIVDALATHVLSVAAELNERSPMTEARWELAEELCQPPKVYNDAALAPICSALIDLVRSAPEHLRRSQKLVERILLPLIQQSRDENWRWTSVFLRNYDASGLAPGLPSVPAKPKLLQILLENFPSCMPTSEFDILSDFIIYTNHPPQAFHDLAEQLETYPQVYKRNDVQHWKYSTAPPALSSACGTSHGIVKVLQHGQFAPAGQTVAQGLITPVHLQTHEHRMLEQILNNYSSNPTAWTQYLDHYKPPLQDDEHIEPRIRWRQHCRPIIQHAISLVADLRTPTWQKDPQRKQIVLPDTFALRLRLLTYPNLYPASQQDECIETLVSEVRTIIEELASSNRPYHTQWKLLITAMKQCAQRHWRPLALHLGKLDDAAKELSMAELLCVDAAEELLTAPGEKAKGKAAGGHGEEVEGMVRAWKESGDEEYGVDGAGILCGVVQRRGRNDERLFSSRFPSWILETTLSVKPVLGDRKNIHEIAVAFEKAYGIEPILQREGSIDELYARMQKLIAEDPANVYAWLPLFYQFHILNGRCHIAGALDNKK
ncbi:hypothetical protein Q7P35_006620 [Cladosporium inversicolor]